MIIQYTELARRLPMQRAALFLLFGQDHYLLQDAAHTIKKFYHAKQETEHQIIEINQPQDWHRVIQEANSYSLFSEHVLLDIRYEQKTWDTIAKTCVKDYLASPNERTLILIRTSQSTPSGLQWIAQQENACLVQITSFTARALQEWIKTQLNTHHILYDPEIPALIQQHTQNNMLACAQVIEKLTLTSQENERLTPITLFQHLDDQSIYATYELADLLLKGDGVTTIQRLRYAQQQRTEPTLILWFITQEIRQLIGLTHQVKQQKETFLHACQKMKIWPKRIPYYTQAIERMSAERLYSLLQTAQQLDQKIKSHANPHTWMELERIILQFCMSS